MARLIARPIKYGTPVANPEAGALCIDPDLEYDETPEIDSGGAGKLGGSQGTDGTIKQIGGAVGAPESEAATSDKTLGDAGAGSVSATDHDAGSSSNLDHDTDGTLPDIE